MKRFAYIYAFVPRWLVMRLPLTHPLSLSLIFIIYMSSFNFNRICIPNVKKNLTRRRRGIVRCSNVFWVMGSSSFHQTYAIEQSYSSFVFKLECNQNHAPGPYTCPLECPAQYKHHSFYPPAAYADDTLLYLLISHLSQFWCVIEEVTDSIVVRSISWYDDMKTSYPSYYPNSSIVWRFFSQ